MDYWRSVGGFSGEGWRWKGRLELFRMRVEDPEGRSENGWAEVAKRGLRLRSNRSFGVVATVAEREQKYRCFV